MLAPGMQASGTEVSVVEISLFIFFDIFTGLDTQGSGTVQFSKMGEYMGHRHLKDAWLLTGVRVPGELQYVYSTKYTR